jgi:hypothetical protein
MKRNSIEKCYNENRFVSWRKIYIDASGQNGKAHKKQSGKIVNYVLQEKCINN